MMKSWAFWFCILLSVSIVCHAQVTDELDDEFDQLDAQLDAAFDQQDKELEKAFLQVKKAVEAAYSGVTKKIEVNWGEDIVLPEPSSWTTYSEDYGSRVVVDFEKGTYRIESVVTNDVAASLIQLKQFAQLIAASDGKQLAQKDVLLNEIQQQLNKQEYVGSPLSATKISQRISQPQHISMQSILPTNVDAIIDSVNLEQSTEVEHQALMPKPVIAQTKDTANLPKAADKPVFTMPPAVDIPKQKIIQVDDNQDAMDKQKDTMAQRQAENLKPAKPESVNLTLTPELIAGKPESTGTTTKPSAPALRLEVAKASDSLPTKLVLDIPFVNSYQRQLIETRFDQVKALAEEYQVDVSLILAIIETESSFNPMATSPIPAFGLMQLVPNTAAVDVYAFLHGQKKVVTPDFLYDQDNNLRFGTVYLHLLTKRYFRNVQDPLSRLYCAVASYNTGVGNVAKTLVQQKSVNQAVKRVNTMQAPQLYDYLQANLPAQETKNYLRKVLARKQKYTHFD